VHDPVHLTGEPGGNGKGPGTTLGTAKKCLTRLPAGRMVSLARPHGAARAPGRKPTEVPTSLLGRTTGGGFGGRVATGTWWVRNPTPPPPGGEAGVRVRVADPAPRPSGRSTGDETSLVARHRGLRVTRPEDQHRRYQAPGPSGRGGRDPAPAGRPAPRPLGHGGRRPEERGARGTAPGRDPGQLATVGPEELARETPSVTRGHHRFSGREEPGASAATSGSPATQLRRAEADREP